jgi:hypothetical protein
MAMACLRLVTFPPLPDLPDRNVPFFLRCIALFTVLLADFPYRGIRPPESLMMQLFGWHRTASKL